MKTKILILLLILSSCDDDNIDDIYSCYENLDSQISEDILFDGNVNYYSLKSYQSTCRSCDEILIQKLSYYENRGLLRSFIQELKDSTNRKVRFGLWENINKTRIDSIIQTFNSKSKKNFYEKGTYTIK